MLNKLLSAFKRSVLNKVARLESAPLSFDGFRWSMVLLCDFIAYADDGTVRRVFGETSRRDLLGFGWRFRGTGSKLWR
jgi:hypothetical protein